MDLSAHAFQTLESGKSAIERVSEFAKKLPGVDEICFLGSEPAQNLPWEKQILRESWSLTAMLDEIVKLSRGFDHVFYFFADEALLDIEIALKMYENHLKYFADFSYGDGFPKGITIEMIKTSIIPQLVKLSAQCESKSCRFDMFSVLVKNINAFDIETEISPQDLRMLRLDLNCGKKQDFLLVRKILQKGVKNYAELMDFCEKYPGELRTRPYYYSIQVSAACPQKCSYCYYPALNPGLLEDKALMALEQFQTLLEKIKDFSENAVINLSPFGEPALHPGIYDIMSLVLDQPFFSCLIETSGIGWNQDKWLKLKQRDLGKLDIILSLDSVNPEVYGQLRGQGFNEALGCSEFFLEHFKENLHVQAVRMNENEDDLESFYKSWKEKTSQLIIQKYDDFCGVLPSRKVTDISPLKRIPCWHLKRDMVILLDGSVPMCRQDAGNKAVLGNVFTDSLDDIWNKNQEIYLKHIQKDYPSLCRNCDEYYTFNF